MERSRSTPGRRVDVGVGRLTLDLLLSGVFAAIFTGAVLELLAWRLTGEPQLLPLSIATFAFGGITMISMRMNRVARADGALSVLVAGLLGLQVIHAWFYPGLAVGVVLASVFEVVLARAILRGWRMRLVIALAALVAIAATARIVERSTDGFAVVVMVTTITAVALLITFFIMLTLVGDYERSAKELAEANDALRDTNRRVAVVDRAKGSYLAGAERELQQLVVQLRAFRGRYHGDIDAAGRARLARVMDEMYRLSSEMRAMSETAMVTLNPKVNEVEIGALIAEIVAMLGPAARARNVSIHAAVDAMILVDGRHLRPALVHLVTTAIQRTHQSGRVVLEVSGPEPAVIDITHTGQGMSKRELAKLSGPDEGPPSSLTFARRAVRDLGGDLAVSSSGPDRGTTYRITLPVGHG